MKPDFHAEKSAERFGGKPDDYLDIHSLLDSTKGAVSDMRHRMITHNSFFITHFLPRIFGETRINSDGKVYSVRDIGEQHVLEDYSVTGRAEDGFIPNPSDFAEAMDLTDWMRNGANGALPPSHPGNRRPRPEASSPTPQERQREHTPAPKVRNFPPRGSGVIDGAARNHTPVVEDLMNLDPSNSIVFDGAGRSG